MPTPTENGLGAQAVLRVGTDPASPFSFAETPGGLLLLANGIDPMLKWDGLAGSATAAGVRPPGSALQLGGSGLGYVTGKLAAYQRFIDTDGNVSDLSPVSNLVDFGRDGFVEDASYDTKTGVVTVLSFGHGLATGDAVAIDGSDTLPILNGQYNVTVVDKDRFTLGGLSVTGGYYGGGAVWTMGIQTVAYVGVPVPTEAKVARRQILRNLSGNLDVLYVDVDTTDLAGTVFTSQNTDPVLAAGTPVPLTYGDDDLPFADRNGVPPSHKAVIASHKGRIFATADAAYTAGHAEVTFNGTLVRGVGTAWRQTFAGRLIYLDGATKPYGIAAVDEAAQTLTLSGPFLDAPRPFTTYAIRPEPGERRLVYYSEPGLPESWPAYNALAIPETNDDIVGLVSLGQYLYIVERRHVHRLTSQGDPQDGYVFLASTRGSINHRTMAVADNVIYALDEIGIHRFDGQESEPISLPVQNLFQNDGTTDLRIDWSADQTLWHAALDPVRDTVRWFVRMAGYDDLYHAVCYNYRTERFWVEEYPTGMTASTETTFGARRSLCGTTARRVVCLGEGTYDGVQDGLGTLRGAVTSSDATHLVDTSASFVSVEGAPVYIVDGPARDQQRVIATVTATGLEVTQPWDVEPPAGSTYQIGGIPWSWRSGWFRYVDGEEENPRDVEVVFRPVGSAASLDMRLFFDHMLTPRAWDRAIEQDGVSTAEGDPHINVDLTQPVGWARQRITGHANTYSGGDRFVSVGLSGVQTGEPTRVSQVIINGVEVD
jgi:hypothetical protein